jgi:hypothetical protein
LGYGTKFPVVDRAGAAAATSIVLLLFIVATAISGVERIGTGIRILTKGVVTEISNLKKSLKF